MNPPTEPQGGDTNAYRSWWHSFDDRASDDRSIGPARRVEIAVRCARCWGQASALMAADDRCRELSCLVYGRRLDAEDSERQWHRMVDEANRNVAGARVGGRSAYAENAKFVLKLLPEMDRDRARFEGRVKKAQRTAAQKSNRSRLTRLDFDENGTVGFLFLQASALVAGLNAAPREISVAPHAHALTDELGHSAVVGSQDAAHLQATAPPAPAQIGVVEDMVRRMGVALMAGQSAAFACKLGLKAILLTRTDEASKTHDLAKLYDELPEDCRSRMRGDFSGLETVLRDYGPGIRHLALLRATSNAGRDLGAGGCG